MKSHLRRRSNGARALLALVALVLAALPSTVLAAKEGELCGQRGGWSASCDGNLKCDYRSSSSDGAKVGVCVEAVRRCGGLLGAQCAENEYCDFAIEALCGAADQTGVCKVRPANCTFEYLPVCGCDDRTYSNACAAHAAGVSVAVTGACTTCSDDRQCAHGYCERGPTCQFRNCPPPQAGHCETCGDGSMLSCKRALEPCPEGQVREIVEGCYGECVDRRTCEPPKASCEYGGKKYQVGQTFPASDGCNSCRCDESGSAQCTLKLCNGCNYDEPNKRYVVRSAEQCKAVKFRCEDAEEPFFNNCGCGCVQKRKPAPAPKCQVGGCSGQLCTDASGGGAISTCEWREEYACYRKAECGVQSNGRCGWTQTPELRACLGR